MQSKFNLAKLTASSINRFVQLDPESKTKLLHLNGRTIALKLKVPQFNLLLHFDEGAIRPGNAEIPQTTIIVNSPQTLFMLIMDKKNRQQYFNEGVELIGDVPFGQAVIKLFDELKIDWQEPIAKLIGDVPTHQMGKAFDKVKSVFTDSLDAFSRMVNEYVQQEMELFPSKQMIHAFRDDIDILRLDIERLEVKIQLLEQALRKAGSH